MGSENYTSRVLFHVPNGFGLGHLSRQVALARTLLYQYPSLEVLLLSESAYGFKLAPDLPFINVPSTAVLRTEAWTGTGSQKLGQTLYSMLESILLTFRPGAIVHDTLIWPVLFEIATKLSIKQALVLRDRRGLQGQGLTVGSPLRGVDLLLYPYEEEEDSSLLELDLPHPNIVYIGKINRTSRVHRNEIENRLGIDSSYFLITITGGGGGFPGTKQFYELTLQALDSIKTKLPNYIVVLVLGPGYDYAIPDLPRIKLQVWHQLSWMPDLIAASNLVICQAGYNTLAEVQMAKVPAVIVPGHRTIDDQYKRAYEVTSKHQDLEIFSGTEPFALGELILKSINEAKPQTQGAVDIGARQVSTSSELEKLVLLGRVSVDHVHSAPLDLGIFRRHI